MWYLVVSIPALCPLSYFVRVRYSPSDFKNINERRVQNLGISMWRLWFCQQVRIHVLVAFAHVQ